MTDADYAATHGFLRMKQIVAEADLRFERYEAWRREHAGDMEYSKERHLFSSHVTDHWSVLSKLLRAASRWRPIVEAAVNVHAAHSMVEHGADPAVEKRAVDRLLDVIDEALEPDLATVAQDSAGSPRGTP